MKYAVRFLYLLSGNEKAPEIRGVVNPVTEPVT